MIDLYSFGTPNGQKVTILLEETGLPYTYHKVDLGAGEHKTDGFLQRNPNGRIPVLVDREAGGLTLSESGAILWYLAEKTGQFLPASGAARHLTHQWLMFQMSALGPMFGQSLVFQDYFPETLPRVIARYANESRRICEVLDGQLAKTEFLAGDYSIADMAAWPWINVHALAGVVIDDLTHLCRWSREIEARPAVQIGMARSPLPGQAERLRTAKSITSK